MRISSSVPTLGMSLVLCLSAPTAGYAVEETFGLYGLGSGGVGAGQTPPAGVYFTTGVEFGTFQSSVAIPFGGLVLTAKAAFQPAIVGNLLAVMSQEVLGGHLSFSATSGLANVLLDASVVGPLNAEKSAQGWGAIDTTLTTALGWDVSPTFSHKLYVSVFLPTGRYEPGFFPDAGLNRFGADVSWGATSMEPTNKIELSGKVGFTYEGYNPATLYQSGDAVHFEEGLSKHFDNGLRLGVISYQYIQVSPDTGAGATLGPFETHAVGVGPSAGYTTLINGHIVSFDLQATREVLVQNRLRQTSGLFSITYKF
jgi:hypothetical protein